MKKHVTSFQGLKGAQNKKREIELWDPPIVNKFGMQGENILKVNHFCSKKWCITSIILHNKLKSWWHALIILKTSKKL